MVPVPPGRIRAAGSPRRRSSPTFPAGTTTITRAAFAAFRRGAGSPRRSSAEDARARPRRRRAGRARPRCAADASGSGAGLLRALVSTRSSSSRPRAVASSPAITSRRWRARCRRPTRFPCRCYASPGDSSRSTRATSRRARSGATASPGRTAAARRYPDRGAIMAGALAARGCELACLATRSTPSSSTSRASARIRLADGGDDAGHLRRQDRPSLYADRPRARSSAARCRQAARPCRRSAPGSPPIRTRCRR